MSGQQVFVAVPVYGGMEPAFVQSLLRLVGAAPCPMALRLCAGDSLVSRARNTLTAAFLKTDCTDVLFLDSDLVFSVEQIARLLAHDVDVVGGLYPKKQQGRVAWVLNGWDPPRCRRADGLAEVRYIGTGCLRVRRRVFERMIETYGETLRYSPDAAPERTEYDLWSVGTYGYAHWDGGRQYRRYLSEDWFFCQRWLDLGGQVWADTSVVLKHVGAAVYPLLTQEEEIFGAPGGSSAAAGAGGPTAPAPAPASV